MLKSFFSGIVSGVNCQLNIGGEFSFWGLWVKMTCFKELQPGTLFLFFWNKNIVFLHYTTYFWKKAAFSQFQSCCPQAPCTACPRTALIIGGRRNSWLLPQFLPRVVWKMKKAKRKGQLLSIWIQYKFVVILVIYYAVWNKWPPSVTNACSGEEKQQIIQNKTLTILSTTWLYWIKNKTATDFNSLYYTKQDNYIQNQTISNKICFFLYTNQSTNLYVQRPMNNRRRGKLYWCLYNPDSWKIEQILRATIVGKIYGL